MGKRNDILTNYGFKPKPRESAATRLSPAPAISKKRNRRLFQLTLFQTVARKHGRDAYMGASKSGQFDKRKQYNTWRMPPRKHRHGGSGYDEMQRTALARDMMAKIHKRVKNRKIASNFAAHLSQDRANTDALTWYLEDGRMGGHPGALRDSSHGTNVVKGHTSRDRARAKATEHEFNAAVPNIDKASIGDLAAAGRRMAARAQVETLRTMSTPLEEFKDRGSPSNTVFHARHGDLSNAGNLKRTAAYAQDQRERLKWDTARKLMGMGMNEHVPEVMQHYINEADGDHTAARINFNKLALANEETRVNTATRSQAAPLAPNETLEGTRGRKRALSLPRITPPMG